MFIQNTAQTACVQGSKVQLLFCQGTDQTPWWVARMPRMERVLRVQLLTDALLSTPGSKTCYRKELCKTQRCESCSGELVLCEQVSRDTQLWSQFCCAGWSKPPIICVSKVGTPVLWDHHSIPNSLPFHFTIWLLQQPVLYIEMSFASSHKSTDELLQAQMSSFTAGKKIKVFVVVFYFV